MPWYAKPLGAYSLDSFEGAENARAYAAFFRAGGEGPLAADEAIAGMLGNVMSESGLNPWRWQFDDPNLNWGYGLFQYTPAYDYLYDMTDVPYYSPNYDVNPGPSPGATPDDAICQLIVMSTNRLNKWVSSCWRTYWNSSGVPMYPELWALHTEILTKWGNGSSLSMDQFWRITDIREATFAFLACFEGPNYPNLDVRVQAAEQAYELIRVSKMPIWMMLRKF